MLLESGADPDAADEFVNVYQTARENSVSSLEVMAAREAEFYSSGLNPRANFRGCTPLHYAALIDNVEVLN